MLLTRSLSLFWLLVVGVLALPLDESALPTFSFSFSFLAALAVTISLTVLLVSCTTCRRQTTQLTPESSQAALTVAPNHASQQLPPSSVYEDLDQALSNTPRAPAAVPAQNPFTSASEQSRQNVEDLYTKPNKGVCVFFFCVNVCECVVSCVVRFRDPSALFVSISIGFYDMFWVVSRLGLLPAA